MNAQQIIFVIWIAGLFLFSIAVIKNVFSMLTLTTFLHIKMKDKRWFDIIAYAALFLWPFFFGYLIYLRIRYIYDYPNQPVTFTIKKLNGKTYIAVRKRRKNSCEGCVGDAHGRLFSNELCKKLGNGKCDYHIWEEI